MKLITILNFLFLIFICSKSNAAAEYIEDDGLAFDRLLKNVSGGYSRISVIAASAASTTDDKRRLAVLDTVAQLEFLSEKLPGVAFDVLVLGAMNAESMHVAELCDRLGSKLTMLGAERQEHYLRKRRDLGIHREKEAKFCFGIMDVVDTDAYDVIFMAGKMNSIMPSIWYEKMFLDALKPDGCAYLMDVDQSTWDTTCHSWKSKIVKYPERKSLCSVQKYGFYRYRKGEIIMADKRKPMALARPEPSMFIADEGLPEAFSGLNAVDVFRKIKLDIPEPKKAAAAEG